MDQENSVYLEEIGQLSQSKANEAHEMDALTQWVQSSDDLVANKALKIPLMGEVKFASRQAGQYLKPIVIRTLWITFLFILMGQLFYIFYVVPTQPQAAPMPLPIAIEQLGDDLPEQPRPPARR